MHKDKDYIHCYLVTNSVSYEDGRKLHNTRKDLERMKQPDQYDYWSVKLVLLLYGHFAYNKDRWKHYSRKEMFYMATKSANLYARIEPDVKEKAESILSTLGIPASSAINMFYKQIILQRGLPFEVKIPSARPVDISTLSEAEFNEELEKGYADMQAGRRKNAKKAFADIRKDYGL